MINALGLYSTEDPNKEAVIAEIVMRHLDRQRRDAQDGEIKAAVDDLEGSVEHWSAQVESWMQRRKYVNTKTLPIWDANMNKSELERCRIEERLRELKEDINMLNGQNRAEELYGPTISSCAIAIRDMETSLSDAHQSTPSLAVGVVIERVESPVGDTTVQPKTEDGVELERGDLNDRQIEEPCENGKLPPRRDDEVDQTETIESSHTPTTSNPSDGATYASSSTQTDVGHAATPASAHEEHAKPIVLEREQQLLALHQYRERLEQLRTTADKLAETRERLKDFLDQPNNKSFSSCTGPLRARISRLSDDAAALMASFNLSEQEVSSEEHELRHRYRDMRMRVAGMYIGTRSYLRESEHWESCQKERIPYKPARRINTADQMSWMKPMRPQRKQRIEETAIHAQREVMRSIDEAGKRRQDSWCKQTADSSTPSPGGDGTLIAQNSDESYVGPGVASAASSVSRSELQAEKEDDGSTTREMARTALGQSHNDQGGGKKTESSSCDEKYLNSMRSRGLRYWQHHQLLKSETEMLESSLEAHPAEAAAFIENYRKRWAELLRDAEALHKETRSVPEMKRLTRNLSDILGEGFAMGQNLLYLEEECKRYQRATASYVLPGKGEVGNEDSAYNSSESAEASPITLNGFAPTYQQLYGLGVEPNPQIATPEERRDSGYFEVSLPQEDYVVAVDKYNQALVESENPAKDEYYQAKPKEDVSRAILCKFCMQHLEDRRIAATCGTDAALDNCQSRLMRRDEAMKDAPEDWRWIMASR